MKKAIQDSRVKSKDSQSSIYASMPKDNYGSN